MWGEVISKIRKIEAIIENSGLPCVFKIQNPPNAPQIQLIWKQKVYAGNWSAKSREVLIRRVKKVKIDQDIIVKMFENLGDKINSVADNGLQILIMK